MNSDKCFSINNEDYMLTVTAIGDTPAPDIAKFFVGLKTFINDGMLTGLLINMNRQIATMESCTSGLIASNITDYEGSSAILKGSYITYSNEAKIAAGVDASVIDTYGVYSSETAAAMSEVAMKSFNSDIALGITGSFSNVDPNNADSVAGEVFFNIKMRTPGISEYAFHLNYKHLEISRKALKQKTVDIALSCIWSILV